MAMHLQARGRRAGRRPRLHDPLRRRHRCPAGGSRSAAAPSRSSRSSSLPAVVAVDPRLRDLQAPGQGRLLRDPDPGAGGGVRHPAHRHHQADRRRSTGLNNFTSFFGYNLYDPVNKRMIYIDHRRPAGRLPAGRLAALPQPVRRAPGRDPRRRGAGAVPRLRPGQHQAGRLRRRGRDGEHRRGHVRADRRASSRRRTSTPPPRS